MLVKTEKGRQELRPGHRSLGQRERALLLVADGQQSESQMASLFSGDGRRLLDQLLDQGYLERRLGGRSGHDVRHPAPHPSARPTAPANPTPGVSVTASPTQDPPANLPPNRGAGGTVTAHGESFTGARSIASARMFLFDLSERLFAPRDKLLAQRYREALREARDPLAMLAVGRALMADVETLAGSERADSISERLAKLLPPELLDQAT